MNIKISIKQIGSRKKGITEKDFFLEDKPRTVGELITYAVHTCVNEYNKRVENGENITSPLSAGDIDALGEIGKIAFGINYGGKTADMKKAVEDALLAYEDGLFRIFVNGSEAGKTDDMLELSENDNVTFIRLTMLAGGMF